MRKILTQNILHQAASCQLAKELCTQYLLPATPFILFLEGTLGSGKTFFAQEILKNLGVKEAVSSPTYALVNEYAVKEALEGSPAIKRFCHWDFYRLEDPNDFFARGFQDLTSESETSHLVEWAERLSDEAKSCFGKKRFKLTITFGDDETQRNITLCET